MPICRGDLDLDGDVDGNDLNGFTTEFGSRIIDSQLSALANDFGRNACPVPLE